MGFKSCLHETEITDGGLSHIPAKHKFGVLGNILLHQVLQQTLHDLSEILQFIVQGHGEKTGDVTPVPLRETLLGLQSVDELREKDKTNHHMQVKVSPGLRSASLSSS